MADGLFAPQDEVIKARMASGSMFPFVPAGSVLYLARRRGRVAVGDIVLFRAPKGWTCHRVTAVVGEQVWTWGDWTLVPDPPRFLDAIDGRCVAVLRKGTLVDMDWPLMRLLNGALARTLPALKRGLGPLLYRLAGRNVAWGNVPVEGATGDRTIS